MLQLALMESFGARVILGGSQDKIISRLVASQAWFPATILCPQAGYSNPFGVEGFKTIAFEKVDALGGYAPDRVYVPAGSGDGTYGVWKGFRELAELKVISSTPRMIACQPPTRVKLGIARLENGSPSRGTFALRENGCVICRRASHG